MSGYFFMLSLADLSCSQLECGKNDSSRCPITPRATLITTGNYCSGKIFNDDKKGMRRGNGAK
jgi:hypothetical protein